VIARGWTVSGIYTAHTGHPFTVDAEQQQCRAPTMTGLPNVNGDTDGPEGRWTQWFNKAAFTPCRPGHLRQRGTQPL
jgi:hypothetical protein